MVTWKSAVACELSNPWDSRRIPILRSYMNVAWNCVTLHLQYGGVGGEVFPTGQFVIEIRDI
jgi:hypothetical protein